jgi:hypothetical protein
MSFLMTWNHIIDNMGQFSLNDFHLRDVFYRKIKDEPEMSFDVKDYERMSDHDTKKTYVHLKRCVEKVITMQEQRKNLADREALLAAKDSRRDHKTAAAAQVKTNLTKGQARSSENQDKALKTEQGGTERTPNAKARGGVAEAPGTDVSRRPSIPGAKAKAVGVPRSSQPSCISFFKANVPEEKNVFSHMLRSRRQDKVNNKVVVQNVGGHLQQNVASAATADLGVCIASNFLKAHVMQETHANGCTQQPKKLRQKQRNQSLNLPAPQWPRLLLRWPWSAFSWILIPSRRMMATISLVSVPRDFRL